MTKQQKDIILIATGLDGFSNCELYCEPASIDNPEPDAFLRGRKNGFWRELPNYFEDEKTINRVIRKLSEGRMASSNPADYPRWTFITNLCKELNLRLFDNGQFIGSHEDLWTLVASKPNAKAKAIVKALRDYCRHQP
jgi:hypothetical protein